MTIHFSFFFQQIFSQISRFVLISFGKFRPFLFISKFLRTGEHLNLFESFGMEINFYGEREKMHTKEPNTHTHTHTHTDFIRQNVTKTRNLLNCCLFGVLFLLSNTRFIIDDEDIFSRTNDHIRSIDVSISTVNGIF